MLRIQGKRVYLQEFSEENLRDPRYFGWLRDLEVMRTIYRLEYLMPMQFSEVESYVRDLWVSETDCYFALHISDSDKFIGTVRLGQIYFLAGRLGIRVMIC